MLIAKITGAWTIVVVGVFLPQVSLKVVLEEESVMYLPYTVKEFLHRVVDELHERARAISSQ